MHPWNLLTEASCGSAGTRLTQQTPVGRKREGSSHKSCFFCWCTQSCRRCCSYLVLEENDELRAEDEATELSWLRGGVGHFYVRAWHYCRKYENKNAIKIPHRFQKPARQQGSRYDWWRCCWGHLRWFPLSLSCSDMWLESSSPLWVMKGGVGVGKSFKSEGKENN